MNISPEAIATAQAETATAWTVAASRTALLDPDVTGSYRLSHLAHVEAHGYRFPIAILDEDGNLTRDKGKEETKSPKTKGTGSKTTAKQGSEKQLAFIQSLAQQRTGWEDLMIADSIRGVIDGKNYDWRTVRDMIDVLKGLDYTPKTQSPARAQNDSPTSVTPGYYLTDGTVYKVQENKAGTRCYAKAFNTESRRWEYAQGAMKDIRPEHKDGALEAAKRFGRETGVCMVCNRELTNPNSIASGIGPVCSDQM